MHKLRTIKKPQRHFNVHPQLPRVNVNFTASLISAGAFMLLSIWLLIWRLDTQTAGLVSSRELTTLQNLNRFSPWWQTPSYLYGPYYLLLRLFNLIGHNLTILRLTSVICGGLVVAGIYWLINELHGWRIAFLATAILITNYGFLTITRLVSPQISQLLAVTAIALVIYIINTWDNYWTLLVFSAVVALVIYIPGGIWLGLTAIGLSFTDLKDSLKETALKLQILLYGLFIILVAPLVYRLVYSYTNHQMLTWLGYGLNGRLSALKELGLNFVRTPLDLFAYESKLPADLAIKHLPILSLAASVIVIIGLLSYISRLTNPKWRLITILLGVMWLLSSLGVVSVYALLPLLSVAAATGLTFLLKQWYEVFPRNPFARYFGLFLMAIVVAFSCFFAARTYFVVWANDPVVNANYTQRL